MPNTATFPIEGLEHWKKQVLFWVAAQPLGIYLDNNLGSQVEVGGVPSEDWECLAAANALDVLETKSGNAFEQLAAFQHKTNGWMFGFFAYDLKNELEALSSEHFDGVGMPDMVFFSPGTVVRIKGSNSAPAHWMLEIEDTDPAMVFQTIRAATPPPQDTDENIVLQARIPKTEYLRTLEAIRQHIIGGDIYEMNFCQEFFAEQVGLNPVLVFERLNGIGKAPFSCFLRWNDRYLLSASPERFLKKVGNKIISQPIKGTRRRGKNEDEDQRTRTELALSEKDRSENVMIVDLVRNDFARNCQPGSVQVDELCGIYSFATVHQMISTVSGLLPMDDEKPSGVGGADNIPLRALRDCFPMGSMTGAPKVMTMKLIERYERSRRGLYSGAVGYFAPNGDFDFNVVIRSILFNASSGYVSAQVGGAIVYESVPEAEYEECLVKAEGMMRALGACMK